VAETPAPPKINVSLMLTDQQNFQTNLFGALCLPFVRSNKLQRTIGHILK
jgi:hypothetical protein